MTMTTAKRSKTEQKLEAQDMLMHGIGNVLGYWNECPPFEDMTEQEIAEFHAILKREADRVAKMFGYDEAWTN
jgi:hypothetical protein